LWSQALNFGYEIELVKITPLMLSKEANTGVAWDGSIDIVS